MKIGPQLIFFLITEEKKRISKEILCLHVIWLNNDLC